MATVLTDIERLLVNRLQDGLPITATPYADIAHELGLTETEVISTIETLLANGVLTRFGPMWQIEKAGGTFTLAALAVPEDDIERVAGIVNAMPEVAHNYLRNHHYNMWFVVATTSDAGCQQVLRTIEDQTGLAVLNLPKQQEFRVHLRFDA
ncbi:Lrp/AsnC family transcriptional regulator [Leeia oryzae]|uniref:Lrp/AsnC family transcriptional regulator n=1 Tax=Leeia oryzae TaxID=356662 RepID=UPI00036E2741|nr:Lrp/AsnC family transcriptional regulator [Leeia oryzae]